MGKRMAKKSVTLSNGRGWPTQTAARQHFKEMLARYEDDTPITDSGDHADLSALLERYDLLIADGPSKIGAGISRFEKRKSFVKGFPTRGFWVVRVDDSDTDFSYIDAITGSPRPQSQEFYDACHGAISEDLRRAKERQFERFADENGCLPCDETGVLVTFTNARLSHAHPAFVTLVRTFMEMRGWGGAVPTGTLSPSADRQISTSFTDPSDAEAFKAFHHASAIMRIVAAGQGGLVADPTKIRRPIRLA